MGRTAAQAESLHSMQSAGPRREEDRLIKLVLDADSDAETIIDSGSDSEDGTKDWARGMAQRALDPYIKHTVKKGQFMYVKPAFKSGRHFYVNEELERIRTENHEADLRRQLKGSEYKVTGTVVFDRHGEPKDFQIDNIIQARAIDGDLSKQRPQDEAAKSSDKIRAHHVHQRAVLREAANRIEQAQDVRDVATESVKAAVARGAAQKTGKSKVLEAGKGQPQEDGFVHSQQEQNGKGDGFETRSKSRRSNHASPGQGGLEQSASRHQNDCNEEQKRSRGTKPHKPLDMRDDASVASSVGGSRTGKFTTAHSCSTDEANELSDGSSQDTGRPKQNVGQEPKQGGTCEQAQELKSRVKTVADPRARMRQRKAQIYSTSEEDEETVTQRRKGREAERTAVREQAKRANDPGDGDHHNNAELSSDSDKDAPLGKAAASRANQIVLSKPAAKPLLKKNVQCANSEDEELGSDLELSH